MHPKLHKKTELASTIQARRSVRDFLDHSLNKTELAAIQSLISEADTLPFNHRIEMTLVDRTDFKKERIKLGTYGFIRNPRWFILGKSENTIEYLLDYAYRMERLVLALTALEIGSCWLGGAFNRRQFAQTVEIETGQVIPAIIAIGKPAEPRFISGIMRRIVNADHRKAPETLFFKEDLKTPYPLKKDDPISESLKMVRLAPSADNFQPWRIRVRQDRIDFYLKASKILSSLIKSLKLQYLDIGIAICHFDLMQKAQKQEGIWKILNRQNADSSYQYIASWIPA